MTISFGTRVTAPHGVRPSARASTALVVIFMGGSARAAGTALDIHSARGVGMAASVTAMIDDSSGVYYNPAGIAQGRIFDMQIGDTLIIPAYKFSSASGNARSSPEVVPPASAFASGGITRCLSIGVGVFTPFGSMIQWPDGWAGKSLTTSADLATYDINPTAAYRYGPLRIGAGLQIVRATVDLKQKIETGSSEASSELGADSWGVGANVGVQIEVLKKYLSLGAHYRSAIKLDFDGHAHFDNVPVELQGTLHDQPATASFVTPDTLALAAATHPIDRLVLDAEVVWYGWDKFHAISINFPQDASGTLSRSEPKNWKNIVNYRFGGEYTIDSTWRVRGGVLVDPSPSPANTLLPDIPDADRLNLAVGGSYVHPSGFRVDLGYQFIILFAKTSTAPELPGRYSAIVDLVGLTLGYRTPVHKSEEVMPASFPAADVPSPSPASEGVAPAGSGTTSPPPSQPAPPPVTPVSTWPSP